MLTLSVTFCQKYQKPFICVKVIASQRWDVFNTRCNDVAVWCTTCNYRRDWNLSFSVYFVRQVTVRLSTSIPYTLWPHGKLRM